ncbi:hypothetical protein DH2020_006277 [Rehmannia glutinosa]|uniref:RNA methyltransferase n=1 Tax=Rehmannia glutinosa TaxID=99300 RepID=A0ABR0XIT1_REHGL
MGEENSSNHKSKGIGEVNRNNHKSKNKYSYKMKKNKDEKKMERPEESAACAGQQQPSKKRNRKEVAIFGNYRNYYGYRVGQDLDEDSRLKVMKREWFEGKDCLDIGCNSGLITIAIAKKFGCRSILGVDIDGARIEDAHWTLRKVVRTSMNRGTYKLHRSADVELADCLENNATETLTDEKRDNSGYSAISVETDLLNIVSFQKGNFVQSWHPPENTYYHAIFCGRVLQTAAANYKNIQISPEDFQDVLLDKIGFRRMENITSCLSGTKSGFDRPILAFWK